jgi:hypothetical protein
MCEAGVGCQCCSEQLRCCTISHEATLCLLHVMISTLRLLQLVMLSLVMLALQFALTQLLAVLLLVRLLRL